MMSFLKWRWRNKTGLFGSLWYLAMTLLLLALGWIVPDLSCWCFFLAPWSLVASAGWFLLWE